MGKEATAIKNTILFERLDAIEAWFTAMAQPSALIEWAALAACAVLAWLLARLASRMRKVHTDTTSNRSVLFGQYVVDGVLFPLLLLFLAYIAQLLLTRILPLAVFKAMMPILVSLAAIRTGTKLLRAAFKHAPWVKLLEQAISWLAWIAVLLWFVGLLPVLLQELAGIHWKMGGATVTALALLEGGLSAVVVLLVTLWLSSSVESRLLRSATGDELSLRKAASNALRTTLMFVGLMLALSSAGIDLTALSVLSGAVGVGVGFGLQKLAASYVSGFVMLAERSVRIGDSVRVDGFEGSITAINARYTVVRALSGRESVVPNEVFISNRIENLSYSDKKVLQFTVVSVAYDSDVELVMRLLMEAAQSQDRVLRDPAPGANLTNFGPDGLEFTLNYWMTDPENGQQNLRSRVNLCILQALRDHGIEIPYPQRVLHALPSFNSAALNISTAQPPAAT